MFQNQACPTQNRTGDHISFSRKLKLSHICWMLKVRAKDALLWRSREGVFFVVVVFFNYY